MTTTDDDLTLLSDLIDRALGQGADAADAVRVQSRSLSVAWRLGAREHIERAEEDDLGLRVFVGRRQAIVASSDMSPPALDELAERAVAMARTVPEDPFCGLADPAQLAVDVPDVDSREPGEPDPDTLIARAAAAEDAARAIAGVSNSEGAEASWEATRVAVVASNGFARSRAVSRSGLAVSVIAGDGVGMERDYEYSSAVYAGDLRDAAEVGRLAGERAVKRLKPRKVPSAHVPVVFEPRVSRSLLGHLAAAINGAAVARGTTFLKDRMGQRILPPGVDVVDDPLRPRGLRSRPFDGEGLPTCRRLVVEDGILRSWILDLGTARQLGLEPTGHASRGVGGPPSPAPSNFYVAPGAVAPAAMIADIERGLLVTELIGFGVNGVTGDYSRGAGGFWIENGEIAYPVSEVTVAGNLVDMFANLAVADDLVFRYGTDAPTIRVDGMTVAGT